MSRREDCGWDGVGRPTTAEYEKKVNHIFRRCEKCGELHNHCTCEKEEEDIDE